MRAWRLHERCRMILVEMTLPFDSAEPKGLPLAVKSLQAANIGPSSRVVCCRHEFPTIIPL